MGLHDRLYWRGAAGGGGEGLGAGGPSWAGLRIYLPRPTRGVVFLLAACGAAFIAQAIARNGQVEAIFALENGKAWQAWRFVSFQFVHGGMGHLFFNLLGLYFLGPALEREWGTSRFLAFYLACGVAGGATFLLLSLGAPPGTRATLVGASGGVLACLGALAIRMPQTRIFIFPIRWAAAAMVALYVLSVAGTLANEGYAAVGDAAHLGGMLAGAAWALVAGRSGRGASAGRDGLFAAARTRLNRGAWRRRQEREARRQAEIDRILDKVHRDGILSLSGREKKTLQDETRRQREGRA
jgi:membrane associated rhomboid family serine protease